MGKRFVRPIIIFRIVAMAIFLLGSSRAEAIDLSVITNETALYFKIVTVRNMEHGTESLWTRKAEDLIKKDLDATGYFKTEEGLLAVSISPDRAGSWRQGQMAEIGFPHGKLHVFDAQSGQRL